jgi:hypothetical protein
MLEEMVLSDLLGPVGGPEEEIDEQSVRDRYLVGMLAPKRQELSPEQVGDSQLSPRRVSASLARLCDGVQRGLRGVNS